MKNAIAVFAWMATSILVSEFLGYLLHRLLHSGKIGFLSRSHMKHHLVLYGPLLPQRPSSGYQDATTGELALGNVGLEWLIPGAIILGASLLGLHFLHVALLHQVVFVCTSLAWSFLMFSYLHDRMHIAGFWMERNRWLRFWFVAARRSHDIHHWALNDQGLMDKNFGIGFFFFDRLFRTHTSEWPVFNKRGYRAALLRFGDLLGRAIEGREQQPVEVTKVVAQRNRTETAQAEAGSDLLGVVFRRWATRVCDQIPSGKIC
jgi:hypothetical protein